MFSNPNAKATNPYVVTVVIYYSVPGSNGMLPNGKCFSKLYKIHSYAYHDVIPTPGTILTPTHPKMARNLESRRRAMIVHMIRSERFTTQQIAKAAKCSKCSVANIRKKLRLFGSARPRLVRAGRQPNITPLMLDTLCAHLTEKPGLYV
jgi:hypothetical protein